MHFFQLTHPFFIAVLFIFIHFLADSDLYSLHSNISTGIGTFFDQLAANKESYIRFGTGTIRFALSIKYRKKQFPDNL
jgi:hypothetical protein